MIEIIVDSVNGVFLTQSEFNLLIANLIFLGALIGVLFLPFLWYLMDTARDIIGSKQNGTNRSEKIV